MNSENKGIVPTMIDAAAKATIQTHSLRRNISVLEGSGGNIGVLIGKHGKLLVDSGFTVSKPRILEALNRLSSDPISQLLNTHWHTDHTDGNAWVHAAGAKITAHVNTADCPARIRPGNRCTTAHWDSCPRIKRFPAPDNAGDATLHAAIAIQHRMDADRKSVV